MRIWLRAIRVSEYGDVSWQLTTHYGGQLEGLDVSNGIAVQTEMELSIHPKQLSFFKHDAFGLPF